MLELFKKKKKLPNQDRQIPQTIQELIKRYDLDNTDIIKYLDEIIPQIFTIEGGEVNGDIILNNAHFLKGRDESNNLINLIRATGNRTAIGDSLKETRIWSSVKPTIRVGGTVYTIATTDDVNAKTVRTAGADLNDYTENGKYFFINGVQPTNKPPYAESQAGYLEVIYVSNTVILQKWTEYVNNNIWQRQKSGDGWLDWKVVSKQPKILWRDTGGSFMNENQTANLSEPITAQEKGIVLLFQPYRNGSPQSWGWYTHFFPKSVIQTIGSGYGQSITIPDHTAGIQAGKYLYFYDNYIQGNAANTQTVTMFGTNIDNKKVVLTAVWGV